MIRERLKGASWISLEGEERPIKDGTAHTEKAGWKNLVMEGWIQHRSDSFRVKYPLTDEEINRIAEFVLKKKLQHKSYFIDVWNVGEQFVESVETYRVDAIDLLNGDFKVSRRKNYLEFSAKGTECG